MKKPVFLIGFMGSGKTTWGKKMAAAMQQPFLDLDQHIVKQIGMTIPEYFALHGEEKFRLLEQKALSEQANFVGIVSTGGGTPCYFANMDWMLAHGTVLYLRHTSKSLFDRLSKSDVNKRPALKGLSGVELFQLIEDRLTERKAYYEKAHIIVDQMHTPIERLVSLVYDFQEQDT